MANLIEQPEQFKAELKDKWLDYYETNRNWIQALRSSCWFDSVEIKEEELQTLGINENYNSQRPESRIIIGAICSLEPQIRVLLSYLVPLNDNPDSLVHSLGLDFDPELELKKRKQQKSQQEITPSEYLDKIREEIKT